MNFDKESKSRKKKSFLEGGGGGGGGGDGEHGIGGMNMKATIFFIHNILSRPLLQNRIVS